MRHFFAIALLCLAASSSAQDSVTPAPPPGTVIFEKHEKPLADTDPSAEPNAAQSPASSSSNESSSQPAPPQTPAPPDADVTVSDDERDAITFTAYDLDLHLVPATSGIAAHASFTVRNDGKLPLTRIPLQLSSSLVWESLRVRYSTSTNAAFVQHRINTDADHTGVAREAVLTLAKPLAPGASLDLTAIYAGTIPVSSERLERIGAPADEAAKADWDAISPDTTALRGYGNVLWYPVSSAPAFLGDGAKLFDSVGRARLRQQAAIVRLRVAVEYRGDVPDAVYFCGHRELFAAHADDDSVPVAAGQGVATAEFAARALGFRVPSLFIADRAATTTDGALIRAVTLPENDHSTVLDDYASAAAKVQPLLMDWLGTDPLGPLDILDHPGQPFEDDAFLVTALHPAEVASLTPTLAHTLAHSWFSSSHVWLDEGVAQFISLLWAESNDGRQAGLARLQESSAALALAEPDFSAAPVTNPEAKTPDSATSPAHGQSLIDASSEIYYRTKAAAVLWMLRSITSDEDLKQALQLYRHNRAADTKDTGFEQLLEQTSHQDLKWFFDDWVYHDRGLPDLSIVNVAPRPVTEAGGKSGGWLVAVGVRNDGDAAAEVPVTVRSGTLTATERLRIPARSNAATRIVFQDTPTEVIVNDGSVPEMRESIHVEKVVVTSE